MNKVLYVSLSNTGRLVNDDVVDVKEVKTLLAYIPISPEKKFLHFQFYFNNFQCAVHAYILFLCLVYDNCITVCFELSQIWDNRSSTSAFSPSFRKNEWY